MKTFLLICLFLLFVAPLCAQTGQPPAFSIVNKSGAAGKALTAAQKPKYDRALRVYERLVKAAGKTHVPAPKFVMNQGLRYMVWMTAKPAEIGLELKAYDTALTHGADTALAALLAQALSHYYALHDSLPGEKAAADAEYTGGFLAYTAGYGAFDKGPQLIEALYKTYQLPAQVKGSPKLEERKKMSENAGKKRSQLTEVFEVGNLLAALGKYEDAYPYFQYQIKEYQSREIYNNAGVVAVLGALNYFRPGEPQVKFRYPLQIDLESTAGRDVKDFREIRTRMLREAIGHFDKAVQLSPDYPSALLNKACAYALLDSLDAARQYMNEARRAAGRPGYEKTAADIQILDGILLEREGALEKAKAVFDAAASAGAALARRNLNVLLGKDSPLPAAGGTLLKKETIDGLDLSDPYNLPEAVAESEIVLNPQLRLYHNLHPGPNSRYYLSDNTATGQQTYFLLTGPGYTGQTARKLAAGAAAADIDAAYKEPLRTLETPAGQVRVYRGIILLLDSDGKLSKWALYGEN